MRKLLIIILVTTFLVSTPAAAQLNETEIGLESQTCQAPTTIDENTAICETGLSDGSAELVLYSETYQTIVLTDAAAFLSGGEVHQRTQQLQPGENTVTFAVTTVDGNSGVSISTNQVLWAEPLQSRSSIISGPFSADDTRLAAIGGGLGVAIASLFVVLRKLLSKTSEPERLA